jgi:hypothetical protein
MAEKYEVGECLALLFSHARCIARTARGGTSDVGYLQIRDGIGIDEADDRFSTTGPVAGTPAKCSQGDPYALGVFPKICSHQQSSRSVVGVSCRCHSGPLKCP